jgi:hypothetical protein
MAVRRGSNRDLTSGKRVGKRPGYFPEWCELSVHESQNKKGVYMRLYMIILKKLINKETTNC